MQSPAAESFSISSPPYLGQGLSLVVQLLRKGHGQEACSHFLAQSLCLWSFLDQMGHPQDSEAVPCSDLALPFSCQSFCCIPVVPCAPRVLQRKMFRSPLLEMGVPGTRCSVLHPSWAGFSLP